MMKICAVGVPEPMFSSVNPDFPVRNLLLWPDL